MSETSDWRTTMAGWRAAKAARAQRPADGPAAPDVAPGVHSGPVVAHAGVTPYAQAALDREAEAVATAAEGGRNDQLNRSTFSLAQLVASGALPGAPVRDTLAAAARRAGLGLKETEATIKSGFRAGGALPRPVPPSAPADPGLRVIDGGGVEVQPGSATSIEREDVDFDTGEVTTTSVDFFDTREHLAHIRDFALARMCSPWAVLGVCLLRALALVPPNVVLPPLVGGVGSLNAFVALVGPPGAGKGAAEAAAGEAFQWPHVYVVSTGSGEGIAHQYAHREKSEIVTDRASVLFSVPEVDTLASLGKGRQGSTLLSQLRSAFSGEALGFSYADATKRIILERHSYRLGMIVGVQPERAMALLDDADGGTPQRFAWMPATDTRVVSPPPAAPQPLRFAAPDWSMVAVALPEGRRHVAVPDLVRRTVEDARAAAVRGEADGLDGHALFTREKIAMALAVLDGRPVMVEEDWALSGVVMAVSDLTRARIQQAISLKAQRAEDARSQAAAKRAVVEDDARAEAAIRRICGNIRRHLEQGPELAWRDLQHKVAGRDRGYLSEAVDRMVSAGEIRDSEAEYGRAIRLVERDHGA